MCCMRDGLGRRRCGDGVAAAVVAAAAVAAAVASAAAVAAAAGVGAGVGADDDAPAVMEARSRVCHHEKTRPQVTPDTDERCDPTERFRCGGRDARGADIPCGIAVASSVDLVTKS